MDYQRMIEVAGLCVDDQERILLVPVGDVWSLPGDRVRHGEHPIDALIRAFRGQVGSPPEMDRAVDVVSDIDNTGHTHSDRIIFAVRLPVLGLLSGSARWLTGAELAGVRLDHGTARVLGLRSAPTGNQHPTVAWTAVSGEAQNRRQRFAAYGLATDPTGRVLLTLISDGYPGAGSWHLPGGGTDFGESAAAGLSREITEETGQDGSITRLIAVSHRHQRDARGPELRPIDWHGVRVVYRVDVSTPTEPRVLDHGGSTAAAGWFAPDDALALPLTEIAREMIITLA